MSEFRIASRYAKSLLELSQEKKSLAKVKKDMEMLNSVSESNRDFVLMLKNPIVQSGDKLAILTKLFKGKVDKITMSLFEIITRKHREMYLPEMANAFLHLYNETNGIVESTVTTVAPLTAALRKDISEVLDKITNSKKVELNEIVDPELIGGFVLKIGDKQIDESVSSKLRELKLQFQQG
ncbi:MAG: ATP synthase F1 subunit delta [Reichenbachiella sp.]